MGKNWDKISRRKEPAIGLSSGMMKNLFVFYQFEGSLLHSNLPVMANVSGNFSDQPPDEVDGHIVDQHKTRIAIEQLQAKILRTDDMIKSEQKAKQGTNF